MHEARLLLCVGILNSSKEGIIVVLQDSPLGWISKVVLVACCCLFAARPLPLGDRHGSPLARPRQTRRRQELRGNPPGCGSSTRTPRRGCCGTCSATIRWGACLLWRGQCWQLHFHTSYLLALGWRGNSVLMGRWACGGTVNLRSKPSRGWRG